MSDTQNETKAFAYPFELKDVNTDARTFTGLLSTWELDLQSDIIQRGAFSKTLREWRKSGRALPLLDTHDPFSIRNALGRLEAAEEREAGLWTRWKIVRGDDGDEALNRIEDGIVDSLSIGYRPVKWERDDVDHIRHLNEVDLREGSLVLFPANLGARIDPVKAIAGRSWTKEQRRALIQALWEPDIDPLLSPEAVEQLNDITKSQQETQDDDAKDNDPQDPTAGRQPWQDAVLRIRTRQLTNRR